MTGSEKLRTDGVTIVRAASLAGRGRATAFDFAGNAGSRSWIGTVAVPPGFKTGAHHHGATEVAIYVVKGRAEIRWGERLEYLAEIGPGDFAYFPPHLPHQERNLDDTATLDFVVVRSNGDGIAVALDTVPVERPKTVS